MLITMDQASNILNKTKMTLYNYISIGKLKAYRFGHNRVRFDEVDVYKLIHKEAKPLSVLAQSAADHGIEVWYDEESGVEWLCMHDLCRFVGDKMIRKGIKNKISDNKKIIRPANNGTLFVSESYARSFLDVHGFNPDEIIGSKRSSYEEDLNWPYFGV